MNRTGLLATLAICATAVITASMLTHAGPLDPPAGPVAPTYKTLSEVEPRTPINATNTPGDGSNVFIISQPGSYYLTAPVVGVVGENGIRVTAPNVTIDLNGFSITGAAGAADGIVLASTGRIAIHGGTITGWPGRGLVTLSGQGFRIHDMLFTSNSSHGAATGSGAEIWGCAFVNNGGDGLNAQIGAVITNCTASANNGSGFAMPTSCNIAGCVATGNAQHGIVMGSKCTVRGCTSTFNNALGISAADDCVITDNECSANVGGGIQCNATSLVRGNNCCSNSSNNNVAGILVTGTNTRIQNNNCTNNARGLVCTTLGCIIMGNTCSDNTIFNYDIASGNRVGPIVSAPMSGLITGSSGGAGLGSTDPWANFSF